MSRHLVVRVDVVDLDERYGDLPESYDDALGTFCQPVPHLTETQIDDTVLEFIDHIEIFEQTGGQ